MQDRPDAAELLEAIQEFLMKQVAPAMKEDDAMSFRTLVSWNMLGIISREIRDGEALLNNELASLQGLLGKSGALPNTYIEKMQLGRELNYDLCEKIKGEKLSYANDAVWSHVKQTIADKLAIANPRYKVD